MNTIELKDFPNYILYNDGKIYSKLNKIFRKPYISNGYYAVCLKNKTTRKTVRIHRIVAEYFVENPAHKKIVNHKDHNKLNNNYTNLEWVSSSQNNQHSQDNRVNQQTKRSRAVIQYDEKNNKMDEFISLAMASRKVGVSTDMIGKCCRLEVNFTTSVDGIKYTFRYKNKNKEKIVKPVGAIQIKGYDNYFVTKEGYIYSEWLGNYMTINKNADGYGCVSLINKLGKTTFSVHKLVAKYFIGPSTGKEVNHIDHNRCNNDVGNLEYVTKSENGMHKFKNGRNSHLKRKIWQLSLDGVILNTFSSIAEASRKTFLTYVSIASAVQGKIKTYKGYRWQYYNTSIKSLIPDKTCSKQVSIHHDDGITVILDSVKEAAKYYEMDSRRISDSCRSGRKYGDHIFMYNIK